MTGPRVLSVFVWLVIASGVVVVAAAVAGWDAEAIGFVFVMAALAVIFEIFDFGPFPNSRVSLSVGAIVAAAVVAGLTGVVVVVSASVVAQFAAHRKPLMKVAFNQGTLLLSGAAAFASFEVFGTGFGSRAWPDALAPALIAGAAFFAVNSSLVATAIAIDKNMNVFTVWSQAFSWLAPHYVVVGVVALAIATAYDEWGVLGTAVPSVPLGMLWLIVRQRPSHPQSSATRAA